MPHLRSVGTNLVMRYEIERHLDVDGHDARKIEKLNQMELSPTVLSIGVLPVTKSRSKFLQPTVVHYGFESLREDTN